MSITNRRKEGGFIAEDGGFWSGGFCRAQATADYRRDPDDRFSDESRRNDGALPDHNTT